MLQYMYSTRVGQLYMYRTRSCWPVLVHNVQKLTGLAPHTPQCTVVYQIVGWLASVGLGLLDSRVVS